MIFQPFFSLRSWKLISFTLPFLLNWTGREFVSKTGLAESLPGRGMRWWSRHSGRHGWSHHATTYKVECLRIKIYLPGRRNKISLQSCGTVSASLVYTLIWFNSDLARLIRPVHSTPFSYLRKLRFNFYASINNHWSATITTNMAPVWSVAWESGFYTSWKKTLLLLGSGAVLSVATYVAYRHYYSREERDEGFVDVAKVSSSKFDIFSSGCR